MISQSRRPRAREYIAGLAASGHYDFDSREAQQALGISPAAAKLALHRLSRQGLIASPARGFYVIVPPEYRSLRSLPADQFIPALMQRLGRMYYVGLLSAAQYHGAAHQRPQEFQVMLANSRRPIVSGAVRVAFLVRKNIAAVPVQTFNTPRGLCGFPLPKPRLNWLFRPHRWSRSYSDYSERTGGASRSQETRCSRADGPNPVGAAAWLSSRKGGRRRAGGHA